MLVKSTPGVNFTNILCTAFELIDAKSVKKIEKWTVFFTLLGSVCVKGARKTFAKSTPGVNPTKVFFLCKRKSFSFFHY
jgi:hypothetical protein